MRGEYEPDTFTENEVLQQLERAGLHYKNGHRYILSQCPTHDDENPSVQIYKDDWFVNCHSGCGRYHITKAFPELRGQAGGGWSKETQGVAQKRTSPVTEHKYTQYDLMEEWQSMPLIPRDHEFKNLPLDVLDDLGWRWDETKNSYFIPYFSRSKNTIPFSQWRHLSGERRFTFLKDAKPTCYGTWNLGLSDKIFIVEGTSDFAVLDYCSVPCVAVPSAASKTLVQSMSVFCVKNGIQLIYAGDNDAAGDKLREALDEVAPYRVKQPPKKYKDWGDFFVAEGILAVVDYCDEELNPSKIASENYSNDMVAGVAELMGGGTEQKIVNTPVL